MVSNIIIFLHLAVLMVYVVIWTLLTISNKRTDKKSQKKHEDIFLDDIVLELGDRAFFRKITEEDKKIHGITQD